MITDSPHDDFAQYQDDRQLERELKNQEARAMLDDWAFENQIALVELTPYQIRLINGKGKRIDVYPVNKKFHDITGRKRGVYINLIDFLNKYFKAS